nr:non-specific lipid-transfer protein-like protein At2g13820 [Tanacetum cinerariifolium]
MAQHQNTNTIMMILVITMAAFYGCAMAQSGCTSVLVSLSPCLNYITGNTTTPSSSCCSQLSSVVTSQAQCLCQVLNAGGSSLGLNINQTQALALPAACNVQTPPTSQCNAGSPTNSPSDTTPSGTAPSSGTPSGKGSEPNTVPSTDNGSSDATLTRFTTIPLAFSLLVAAYATLL